MLILKIIKFPKYYYFKNYQISKIFGFRKLSNFQIFKIIQFSKYFILKYFERINE